MPDLTQEGLAARGLRVKALEWKPGKFCRQDMFYAETPVGNWMVIRYSGRDFRWAICDPEGNNSEEDWSTPELAKAAAEGDHTARILAALDDTGEPALISRAILDAQLRCMERGRIDTPDEIRAAAADHRKDEELK